MKRWTIPKGAAFHDDWANAACGAMVLAQVEAREVKGDASWAVPESVLDQMIEAGAIEDPDEDDGDGFAFEWADG